MIYFSSYPVTSVLELSEAFDLVSTHFKGWEIVGEGVHSLIDIRGDLERIIPSYDLELSLHAPFSDVNLGSFNRRILDESLRQVIESIEIAAELGMSSVALHPGHLSPISFSKPEKVLDITKESVRDIDSKIGDLGIKVGVENMPDMVVTICLKAEELVHVIEGTDIGICFDVGHANTTREIENFLQLKEKFINVHLHDNDGRSDYHLPLGEGTVETESILRELSGYSGNFVLEARSMDDGLRSKRYLEDLLVK
jgi:sugar phosphate isomerase/epimerase